MCWNDPRILMPLSRKLHYFSSNNPNNPRLFPEKEKEFIYVKILRSSFHRLIDISSF